MIKHDNAQPMAKSSSTRPYDSLPRTGRHTDDSGATHESGMNVRAPLPPDEQKSPAKVTRTYQLVYDRGRGCHRVRTREDAPVGDECDVIGRYETDQALIAALEDVPDKPSIAVFEDEDAGKVYMEHLTQLSDNWVGGGQFDQVTFFADEESANQYVEERQREFGSGASPG